MTAAEAIACKERLLRSDPDYRAKVEALEEERRERSRLLREAQQPIVADLRRVGLQVGSVWDLGNNSEPYPEALPILLDHLKRGGYPDEVMESLARALAVKPSLVYWDTLRALYLSAKGAGEEEGLAVALSACATGEQFDDLVALLHEESRGESRIHFLRPIRRLGRQRGLEIIESLVNDPLFGREARARLPRRKS
jgi:hypothetical protein